MDIHTKERERMKYAFVNGHILDGNKGMHPVSDMAVLVDGEKIVGTAATYQSFSGDPEYDWKQPIPTMQFSRITMEPVQRQIERPAST